MIKPTFVVVVKLEYENYFLLYNVVNFVFALIFDPPLHPLNKETDVTFKWGTVRQLRNKISYQFTVATSAHQVIIEIS